MSTFLLGEMYQLKLFERPFGAILFCFLLNLPNISRLSSKNVLNLVLGSFNIELLEGYYRITFSAKDNATIRENYIFHR